MQTDSRWRNQPYRVSGEDTTIGDSGCGPTCAAMLIETMTGKTFTPVDACKWAMKKGYKALGQGTYYSYFVPQFAEHGIECRRLNVNNLYGNSTSSVHTTAFNLLKDGYYLIACMGKGNWTSSGHFVVVWWEDGKVRINDPYSTKEARINGDLKTFKSQVKYYFAIDARENNKDELTVAVEKLFEAGIINTPEYWAKGTGYSDGNVVSLIKKVSTLCLKDELTEAADRLYDAGIINSPDYWAQGKGYSDENVVALIKKVSTLCK